MKISMGVPEKLKAELPHDPDVPTPPEYTPKGIESWCIIKILSLLCLSHQ